MWRVAVVEGIRLDAGHLTHAEFSDTLAPQRESLLDFRYQDDFSSAACKGNGSRRKSTEHVNNYRRSDCFLSTPQQAANTNLHVLIILYRT